MRVFQNILIFSLLTTLTACAGYDTQLEEMASEDTTEQELNQPLIPPPEEELPPDDDLPPKGSDQAFFFPRWDANSGITESMFERVKSYYDQNFKNFENKQYVVIIDMGKKSNVRRFTLFDLKTGTYERFLTSHGQGSDPNNDGWLDSFSNVSGSKQTSAGYYKTLGTYYGSHGRSLRLEGLSDTNSRAYSRAIVVHGADYVKESTPHAGRSWGCPALDNAVAQKVIDKIKGGALLVIGTSRSL